MKECWGHPILHPSGSTSYSSWHSESSVRNILMTSISHSATREAEPVGDIKIGI